MDSLGIIVSIVTAIGGLEGIKWVFHYLRNRKQIDKEVRAKADGAEIDNLNDYAAGWRDLALAFKEESKEKDNKIDRIYIEIKEVRECKDKHIRNSNLLALENETLKIKRCDKRGCSERIPPSEY